MKCPTLSAKFSLKSGKRLIQPTSIVAKRHGIGDETVRKWRKRDELAYQDRSSRPKRLPWRVIEEERAIICTVRRTTGFSLDDLTFTLRHFLPHLDRDNIYRVLRAEGLNRRPPKQSSLPAKGQGRFRDYGLGYVHIDVRHLPKLWTADGQVRKRYLYVAIDRCTRFAHLAVFDAETAANAVAFLSAAQKSFPLRITHILTDRGSHCTTSDFENACEKIKGTRRTTKPYTPQTKGIAERLNGRIASEVLDTNVAEHADLEILLFGFNHAYNGRRQCLLSERLPIDSVRQHLARNSNLASPQYKPIDSKYLLPMVDEILYYTNEVSQPDSYLRDSNSSIKLWIGGWLHIGDAAVYETDDTPRNKDRIKDVIKISGEWVSSLDVEDLILRHSAVSEIAIIGMIYPKWEERPLAIIVAKSDKKTTDKEIQTYLACFAERGIISRYATSSHADFV